MFKNYKFWMIISVMITALMIVSVLFLLYDSKYHIEKLQTEIIKCKIEYNKYKQQLESIKEKNTKRTFYKNITITAYSPSVEETNEDPENTALMEPPIIGYTCAVSRDLKHMLGKRIYIYGVGVFKVNDLMNKRYEKRIDICTNKSSAIEFGIQERDVVMIDFDTVYN